MSLDVGSIWFQPMPFGSQYIMIIAHCPWLQLGEHIVYEVCGVDVIDGELARKWNMQILNSYFNRFAKLSDDDAMELKLRCFC
jgi:hypothetical protein